MRMTRKRRRAWERKKKTEARGKALLKSVVHTSLSAALFALTYSTPVQAMPAGGQVTGGSAVITQTTDLTTITQQTDKLSINWDKFNIAANERVNFVQPSAQSEALNRVVGQDPSQIYGAMTANGQVFLLNPNGILFAPGANIDVGGLVASTMNLSDQDFRNGQYVLKQPDDKAGKVENKGTIKAREGGYVVLAGRQVDNSGTIVAAKGTVGLIAGGQLALDVPGDGKVNLAVSQAAVQAAVTNSGVLRANGGQVLMTGRASDAMLTAVVNNTGIVEARSITSQNGVIRLDGGTAGIVQNSGTLDASGKGADETGGAITVVGSKVAVMGGSVLDASGSQGGGTVLIGGNYQGKGPEQNAAATYIYKSASISADAITRGDGGKVIVWSDEATRFYGDISAKGGSEGGNGGFVETSGKQYLDAQGSVDASAAKGKAGSWLLDPRNVIIKSGGAYGTAGEPNFTAVNDDAVVTTESIVTALNGGTSVSVNTGSSGQQDGNITVAGSIAKTTGSDATLTLNAANSVIMNSGTSISTTNGKLNVDVRADDDGQYGGYIQLGSGSQIITNGGSVDLYGGNTGKDSGYAGSVDQTIAGLALQGGVTIDTRVGTEATGGGNISLRGSNSGNDLQDQASGHFLGVSFSGSGNSLKSGGGNISITALGHGYYAGQEALSITDASASISAGAGKITLTADTMKLAGKLGVTGDTGPLSIKPLSQTTSIAIGDGAAAAAQSAETAAAAAGRTQGASGIITALKLPSQLFGSVIDPGLSSVTIGAANTSGYNGSAGTININGVTFGNRMILNAPGYSSTPVSSGLITITGGLNATGKTVTLNSYQGAQTTAGSAVAAGSLELLDPRQSAVYDLSLGNNQVGILAADTGRLLYTGSGDTAIGTAGSTNGLALHSPLNSTVTLTGISSDLTINKAVTASASGAALALSAGGDMALNNAAISTNNGNLTLTAGNALTSAGSTALTTGGGSLILTGGSVNVGDTGSLATGGGSLSLTANTGAANIGAATVNTRTGGGAGAGSLAITSTSGDLNIANGAALQTAGGSLSLNAGNALVLNAASVSTTGGTLALTAGNSLTTVGAANVNANGGAVTVTTDTLNLDSLSSIASNGGALIIQPYHANRDVHVGGGLGGANALNLAGSLFDAASTPVFKSGFASYTIGHSNGSGMISIDGTASFAAPLTLRSASGGTVQLSNLGNLDNSGTNQNITIQAGTFKTETNAVDAGNNPVIGSIQSGSGALVIEAGALDIQGGRVSGTGTLDIRPQNASAAITLGGTVGDTGLILPTDAFSGANRVFQDGFSEITVGSSSGSGAVKVTGSGITFTDKTLIQTPQSGGTLTINAPLSTGSDTLTLKVGGNPNGTGAAQNVSGVITAAGLELIGYTTAYGPQTIFDFSAAANQIGTLAAVQANKVKVNNGSDLFIGQVNATSGVTTTRLTNQLNQTVSQDEVSLQVSADGGKLTVDKPVSSSGGGQITLTADQMDFSSGTSRVTGSGNLYLQPYSPSRSIDIGSFAANASNLQLAGSWFNGAVFQDGFNTVTVGRDNGSGTVTVNGAVSFVDSTTIKAGSTDSQNPGTITLSDTAVITATGSVGQKQNSLGLWSGLTLKAKTINGVAGAVVNTAASSSDVYLIADNFNLGDGTSAGAKVTGRSGNSLNLQPFSASKTVGLGNIAAGSAQSADIKFANAQFNDATHKIYSGFGGYNIGYNNTSAINVSGTASFTGNLSLGSSNLTLDAGTSTADAGKLNPTGTVHLEANTMSFGDYATVTGSGSLQLEPYSSSYGMIVGDTSGTTGNNLVIPDEYFIQNGRRAGNQPVFTGSYTDTVTFGSTNSTANVSMRSAQFPNTSNITIQTVENGTVDISGSVSVPNNITIQSGTIQTNAGASLRSTSGDITLIANSLSLNSAAQSIHGVKNLFLRAYNANGNIGLVGDGVSYTGGGLTLRQNMFYVPGISVNGELDNSFSKITIGNGSSGTGKIYVNNIQLNNNLDLLSYNANSASGNIEVAGYLNNPDKTIVMKASGGATGTGKITTGQLALLGGSSASRRVNYDLQGPNAVGRLAANAGNVVFRNEAALNIGAVTGTIDGDISGVTATYAENTDTNTVMSGGNITIGSDMSLTVSKPVTSVVNSAAPVATNILLQSGNGATGGPISTTSEAVISNTGTGVADTSSVTLKANRMLLDPLTRVQGTGILNLMPFTLDRNIEIRDAGTPSDPGKLQLMNTWFSGSPVFQNTFSMLNIGSAVGTGTISVNKPVSFITPVTIQSPGTGGKVELGTAGSIMTTRNLTIHAGSQGFASSSGSAINSGNATLVIDTAGGGAVDASGSITGTGSISITGGNINFNSGGTISGGAGDISLTGNELTFNDGSTITGGSGDVALTGTEITLNNNSNISGSGDLIFTANAMTFNSGSSVTGNNAAATLALRPGDTVTRVALGTDAGGGLQLDSVQINAAMKGTFDYLTVGRTDGANAITVNNFTAPADMIIKSPGTGGNVTVNGTLNMQNRELTISTHGKIAQGAASSLQNVGTLNASSSTDAIDLSAGTTTGGETTFANTITNIGTVSAHKSVAIGSNNQASLNSAADGLSITGAVTSTTDDVLIRTKGNLTIGSGSSVSTGSASGDVYLSAEGTYAHFFNKSTSGANALNPGSGRWLVYSYSPLADDAIPNNPGYSSPGATGTADSLGGLTKDFKYYSYTYNNHNPGTVNAPSYNLNGKRGLLYAYAPVITLDTAERTYGYGKTTIQYTFGGLIGSDATDSAMKASIANSISGSSNISITSNEATNAGTYTNGITATGQVVTDAGYVVLQGEAVDLTIKPRNITVTANATSKVYDGTDSAPAGWNPATAYTVTGGSFYNSDTYHVHDTAASVISGNLALQPGLVNAGAYAGKITGGTLTGNQNYNITVNPGNYTIYKKSITASGLTADNKVYDAGTAAAIRSGGAALNGVVSGDIVNLDVSGMTGRFVDKNVGDGKTVYVSGLAISGSSSGNYSLSNASTYTTTANITPATLTYRANAASRIYGDNNTANFSGGTISGWQGSDTQANATTGTLAWTSSATRASNIGNYNIDGSGLTARNGNYVFVQAASNATALTINPATLTYIANSHNRVYGDNNIANFSGGSVTGWKNSDTQASSTTGTVAWTSSADRTSNVGSYSINGSGLTVTNSNYVSTIAQAAGNATALSITPATLIYTANSHSRVYGDDNTPNFSGGTITGWKNSDTQTNATTGTLTWTSPATKNSNVGSYSINGGGLTVTNSNYVSTIAQAAGNATALTISPATLTYIANTASRVYGEDNPLNFNGGTIAGWKNSDTQGSSTSGTVVWTSAADRTSNVGDYNINGSGLTVTNNNYVSTIDQAAGNATALTITPATLTYTANSASRVYGDDNPLNFNGGTITGWKNSDNQGNATAGTLTWSSLADRTSHVGTYNINGGGLTANHGNYVFAQAAGNATVLNVTQAALTYTANSASRVYGDDNPLNFNGGTVTGWKNSDNTGNSTTGIAAWTSSADRTSNVGSYEITGSGLTVSNTDYVSVIGQASGNATALTVTPAELIYQSDTASRDFGMINPPFSGIVYGFKNGETLATATTGTPVFTTSAVINSIPGKYEIIGNGLAANHGNYTFVQHPNNATAFTIKAANPKLDGGKTKAKQLPGPDGPGRLPGPNSPEPVIAVQPGVDMLQSGGSSEEEKSLGDAAKRWEGISIPVFLTQGAEVTPEGLYSISYSTTGLTLIPSSQNVPVPPQVNETGSRTLMYVTLADGRQAIYNVIATNGVISIEANSNAAEDSMQSLSKNLRKLLVTQGLMAAVDNLSVLPDQIQAVFIRK